MCQIEIETEIKITTTKQPTEESLLSVLAIHLATRPEHGVAFVLSTTTTTATLLLKEKHVYR